MSTLIEKIENNDMSGTQLFATVLFDRDEDSETSLITVMKDGKIKQFDGNNKYNLSKRRCSSCMYIKLELDASIIKICTIQHKGNTLIEIHKVLEEELKYIFD